MSCKEDSRGNGGSVHADADTTVATPRYLPHSFARDTTYAVHT